MVTSVIMVLTRLWSVPGGWGDMYSTPHKLWMWLDHNKVCIEWSTGHPRLDCHCHLDEQNMYNSENISMSCIFWTILTQHWKLQVFRCSPLETFCGDFYPHLSFNYLPLVSKLYRLQEGLTNYYIQLKISFRVLEWPFRYYICNYTWNSSI